MAKTEAAEAQPDGIVVENRMLNAVIEQFEFMGRQRPPVPRAMRMAVARGDLKRLADAFQEVNNGLIAKHGKGPKGKERVERFVDPDKPQLGETPEYEAYMKEFIELLDETFTVEEKARIILYRQNGGGEDDEKYAWKPDMTFEVGASEGLSDAVFVLMEAGLLEIRDAE